MTMQKFAISIPVSWRLPPNYVEALKMLRDHGYSDTGARTQVAALRLAIEDAWNTVFPDTPFPGLEAEDVHS